MKRGGGGRGRSIQAVVDALAARGVEIESDGLRLKPKRKARHGGLLIEEARTVDARASSIQSNKETMR
jgi:hypothetical protein